MFNFRRRDSQISKPMLMLLSLPTFRGATMSSKLAGGPVPWFRVLLPFYRKKLDRSTQFGAVGYIFTLCSSKGYVKLVSPSKFWGSGPPRPLHPQWLRPCPDLTPLFITHVFCFKIKWLRPLIIVQRFAMLNVWYLFVAYVFLACFIAIIVYTW